MTYALRRRIADAAALLVAAALTVSGALALGGGMPEDLTGGGHRTHRPPSRTVTKQIAVERLVHASTPASRTPVAAASPSRTGAVAGGAPAAAAPAPATPRARRDGASNPGRRGTGRRRIASKRPTAGAPAPVATATGSRGYRSLASATAAYVSGGNALVVARTGSGVALDGKPLDTSDELGALVSGLPDGRTAFGRAIPVSAGGGEDGTTAASSPPAGPASEQQANGGTSAASTARTGASGACVLGEPISSADARAASPPGSGGALLGAARSRTESALEPRAGRYAMSTRALVEPPAISLGAGTPAELSLRFLGPVVLAVRAGGTPGSAAAELGPDGFDASAPLVEVRAAGRTVRYTAAEVLQDTPRSIRLGAATLTIGGGLRALRADDGTPPLVGADGTFASAAADVLTLRMPDGARLALGHLEAAVAVPSGGVTCG